MSLADRSQDGEEERRRHAGYAMIIVEHRGRLFSAPNTRAGRQEGRAGVHDGEPAEEEKKIQVENTGGGAGRQLGRWKEPVEKGRKAKQVLMEEGKKG